MVVPVADDIKKQQEEVNRKIDEAYDRLEQMGDNEIRLNEELQELADVDGLDVEW